MVFMKKGRKKELWIIDSYETTLTIILLLKIFIDRNIPRGLTNAQLICVKCQSH